MNIVYFYQYFSTPKGSWGTRVYEFVSEWVKQGHNVTVVTTIYSKSDIRASHFLETQWIEGIQLKVINIYNSNKESKYKRFLKFLAYAFFSCWYAIKLPADIVVVSSGPITVGLPGLVARYIRGRTLVFEARDLWPTGAIELGIINKSWIKFLAYKFEGLCYRASSLIVALSPGMKSYIEKNYAHSNVISITNAANIPLFSKREIFKTSSGIKPLEYAIYTGNIGEVNNAFWMYNAASILYSRGEKRIKIVLVGDGQLKEDLKQAVFSSKIDNFILLDLMPKNELVPLIQNALVSLVPLKGTPVLDTSSPNKFFESLAAGVPVIQSTNGWMKDFLDEHKVGFTISPDDPAALADCLTTLITNPEIAAEMGSRGAFLAKQQFDKSVLSKQMLDSLVDLRPSFINVATKYSK